MDNNYVTMHRLSTYRYFNSVCRGDRGAGCPREWDRDVLANTSISVSTGNGHRSAVLYRLAHRSSDTHTSLL